MTKSQHELLCDLWLTYDMQMDAMKKANSDGKLITASLHSRMAKQLLDTYFDLIEKMTTE